MGPGVGGGVARARPGKSQWETPVAYGLTQEQMAAWGLYVSAAIEEEETSVFAEPAAFLVSSDGVVWLSAVLSAPFVRPALEERVRSHCVIGT